MSYETLLTKLRADMATASEPEEHDYDETLETCKACQGAKERGQARNRIAAIPGPALLEIVIDLVGPLNEQEQDEFFDVDRAQRIRNAIADTAKALGVTDG